MDQKVSDGLSEQERVFARYKPKANFGQCHSCDQPAVVKVQDVPLCIPHMNEEFAGISETVRRIAADIAAAATSEEEKL